jgi:hypothetical protein
MKRRIGKLFVAFLFAFMVAPAFAEFPWIEGTIKYIRVNNDGNSNDSVIVFVNVKPGTTPTGCTNDAFVLPKTDSYHSQTYAAMLMAKATNTPIMFLHSYCAGAYSRANQYIVLE